jgi:short-subunit dehydrogenase
MLVNVSSVVGRRGLPGCTDYCASKFALTGWSESLRPELARLGIHVLVVSPGRIATEFRDNLLEDRFRFGWQKRTPMSSDRCAQIIVSAIRRRRNEVVITKEAKLLLWVNRLLPRVLDAALAWYTQRAEPPPTGKSPEGQSPGRA